MSPKIKPKQRYRRLSKGGLPHYVMPCHPRGNNIVPTQNNAHNVLIFAHVHMSPVVDVMSSSGFLERRAVTFVQKKFSQKFN